MAKPVTIRTRFEEGVSGPWESVAVPDEKQVAQRIAALESIMGMIKALAGFDPRKISREDLYD